MQRDQFLTLTQILQVAGDDVGAGTGLIVTGRFVGDDTGLEAYTDVGDGVN